MSEKESLEEYARTGDLAKIRALVAAGADPFALVTRNATLLHVAAYAGQVAVIEYLVERGLDVNAKNSEEIRPLQMAVEGGHLAAFNALIRLGADVHAQSDEGYQAIHTAAFHDYPELVQRIIDLGVKPDTPIGAGSTPLNIAADSCKVKSMQVLLNAGADVNYRDPAGFYPLFYAVRRNCPAAVQLLLQRGASSVATLKNGYTPMHYAAIKGNERVIAPLAAAALVWDVEVEGMTPLHIGADMGFGAVISEAIKSGANPNIKNSQGKTPIHYALEKNNAYAISELVKAGAEVDKNILMDLAFAGDEEALAKVVENNPEAISKEGMTLLHIAAKQHEVDLMRKLVRNSHMHVNTQDQQGNTPLHFAMQSFLPELAEVLLAAGADISIQNHEGDTALHKINSDTKSAAFRKMSAQANAVLLANKHKKTAFVRALENNYISAFAGLLYLLRIANDTTVYQNGWTALQMAAASGDPEAVTLLVQQKKLNERNQDGQTILWHATRLESNALAHDNKSVLAPLFNAGIDTNIIDTQGDTALHHAAHKGYSHATEALLKHKANPNIQNKQGRTPLHIATENGWRFLVPDLLEYGANPDLPDDKGNTPRQLSNDQTEEIKEMFSGY